MFFSFTIHIAQSMLGSSRRDTVACRIRNRFSSRNVLVERKQEFSLTVFVFTEVFELSGGRSFAIIFELALPTSLPIIIHCHLAGHLQLRPLEFSNLLAMAASTNIYTCTKVCPLSRKAVTCSGRRNGSLN